MKEKTCCFTGHREIPERDYNLLKQKTKNAIVALIGKGVIYFGAGGARGFDTIAAETVLELKKEYPQIKLILVLPCPDQTKGWKEGDIRKYNIIKENADKVVFTADHYFSGCMHVRNRHLVDNSGYCICYLTKDNGGTAFTVNYAKKKGLEIYNVG
jgi:uncharacterized phage-like protein YoqJ